MTATSSNPSRKAAPRKGAAHGTRATSCPSGLPEAPCPSCELPAPGWAEGYPPSGHVNVRGCGTCRRMYWSPAGPVEKFNCARGDDHDAHPWKGHPSPTATHWVAWWCDGTPEWSSMPVSEETFEVVAPGGWTFTTDLIEVVFV